MDALLLSSGGPIELRITAGPKLWRWKGVRVAGTDLVLIDGAGPPEVM